MANKELASILQNGFEFIEAHFLSLPSQGNVYTLAPLTDAKGFTRILVASLQRKVFCLEYSNGKPFMREIPFTYIPSGAEIISVDAVNRSVIKEDFIIGITLKKDEASGKPTHFFNVYSDWDLHSDSALDVISQSCLPLELDFVPYHLYHAKVNGLRGWETVWLLSGSDSRIHMYRADEESHSYEEEDSHQFFPEFGKVEGITLGVNIHYSSDNKRRVTATCGEGGNVHMFSVNVESEPRVEASHTLYWDYPSVSVKIFNETTCLPVPEFLKGIHRFDEQCREEEKFQPLILVGNALESCFVYRNLATTIEGFQLPGSDSGDTVTCCLVCDIDQDGVNEVLVGTYGEDVLIYKQTDKETFEWKLYQSLTVPCPTLSLAYCDVMGDGTFQLIVMTISGIHIFQHNPWKMASRLLGVLEGV